MTLYLILADEPTGNLDTKSGQGVFDLFKMLSINYGKTVIMVTHNEELAKSTDRSVHIRDGSIEKGSYKLEMAAITMSVAYVERLAKTT